MTGTNSPLRRSIGLSGVLRWLLAVAVIIAIGAALAAARYLVAIAAAVFVLVAVGGAYRLGKGRGR